MKVYKIAASLLSLTLIAGPASAALIRITPLGVAVDEQEITDPVPIDGTGFRLTYWGGGTDALVDPVLLIFGVPSGTAPSLSATGSNPGSLSTTITLGGTNVFGGTWNTTTGAAGTFDSSDAGTVYDAIGLPNTNGSQNYTNWFGASGVTSWNLFVHTLTFNPDFNHGNWVEFSTSLPMDSFVVGFGCTTFARNSTSLCRNSGSTEDTPFTFAGHVTTVPEPGILSLLGAGLLLIGLKSRRKRNV